MSFLSARMPAKVLRPSLRLRAPLSPSSWQKLTPTTLKGSFCYFHYSNILELDIRARPRHPLVSVVGLASYGRATVVCGETFMRAYFYFKEFYCISDATMCKFIGLNNSLIEIKSLKIDEHGPGFTLMVPLLFSSSVFFSLLIVCVSFSSKKTNKNKTISTQ